MLSSIRTRAAEYVCGINNRHLARVSTKKSLGETGLVSVSLPRFFSRAASSDLFHGAIALLAISMIELISGDAMSSAMLPAP
jgi:hypothetical protein